MTASMEVLLAFTPDDLAHLASGMVALLGPAVAAFAMNSPWLSASEAARYLRAPLSRVRKLTFTREMPCHRDGRRVLYHRDELDAYVQAGGAISP